VGNVLSPSLAGYETRARGESSRIGVRKSLEIQRRDPKGPASSCGIFLLIALLLAAALTRVAGRNR